MGVVSKYGNLYDVKKNIICHSPVTSSHFESIFEEGQCTSNDEWRNNTRIVRNSRGQEI